jgi:hypothetical protein
VCTTQLEIIINLNKFIYLTQVSFFQNSNPFNLLIIKKGIFNEMAVTWSTQTFANESYVEFNIWNDKLSSIENATVSKFIDGSSAHRVLYMYRAIIKNLTMNTTYSELGIDIFD